MGALSNVPTRGGEADPPSAGHTPDAFPEAKNLATGVSVRYAHDPGRQWYVFRASYGRVDRAAELLIEDGTYTYVARRYVQKYVHGRRKRVLEALIPNLLFAYTTADKADEYVRRTPALSFLSYYYNHFKIDGEQKNPPLTIPCAEMDNFIRATVSMNDHLLFVEPSQCHYKSGDTVRVVDGLFRGVVGKVARVAGQQRVIVTLPEIGMVSTAYIPTAFLEIMHK